MPIIHADSKPIIAHRALGGEVPPLTCLPGLLHACGGLKWQSALQPAACCDMHGRSPHCHGQAIDVIGRMRWHVRGSDIRAELCTCCNGAGQCLLFCTVSERSGDLHTSGRAEPSHAAAHAACQDAIALLNVTARCDDRAVCLRSCLILWTVQNETLSFCASTASGLADQSPVTCRHAR